MLVAVYLPAQVVHLIPHRVNIQARVSGPVGKQRTLGRAHDFQPGNGDDSLLQTVHRLQGILRQLAVAGLTEIPGDPPGGRVGATGPGTQ